MLSYTDGLTEARHDGGLGENKGVELLRSAGRALALTRRGDHSPPLTRSDFAYGTLSDDLCTLAARVD